MIRKEIFTDAEKKEIRSKTIEVRKALLKNLYSFEQYPIPLLRVGDCYPGIWLEHNQDQLFLTEYAPENAWASQAAFMKYQREDGLIPFMLPIMEIAGKEYGEQVCYWHIQCVYSFVRCALEIAKRTGRPEEDFMRIYQAGVRYDSWMEKYRNRAGTGLVEMYCEYDTGHDHDPRVTEGNIPRTCPENDAGRMPDLLCMPILSVDLSAMLYGGRVALAELASMLGRSADADFWSGRAAELKEKIRNTLYDPEDDFYYDRSPQGFRKYRTEHITRLFLNGVCEQKEFERIYHRYFEDPKEFKTPFPYPSMSASDPHFDHSCPKNSWASNSQASTSLRALLWLRAYGYEEERTALLGRWMRAFLKYPETTFQQEINPFDGSPVGEGVNYSPTLILFLEAAKVLENKNSMGTAT